MVRSIIVKLVYINIKGSEISENSNISTSIKVKKTKLNSIQR